MATHLLQIAKKLAHDAGKIAFKAQKRGFNVSQKEGLFSNLVTDIDHLVEEFLIKNIRLHFPDHTILTEEGGLLEGSGEYKWILDPIDGTSNFAHGSPLFAVSIAITYRGKPIIGVVDIPGLNEQFWAMEGRGSHRGTEKITVSKVDSLDKSLLASGFPYDRKSERFSKNVELWAHFYTNSQGVRRSGSAALDLCFVACGRYDGFWEYDLKPWDIAAGKVIVEEAGGMVTNMDGSPLNPKLEKLLASNGRLHQTLLQTLHEMNAETL